MLWSDAGVFFSIPLNLIPLLLLVPGVFWMLAVLPVTTSVEMLCRPCRTEARASRRIRDCLPVALTKKSIFCRILWRIKQVCSVAFSALTLLAGRREEHLAYIN